MYFLSKDCFVCNTQNYWIILSASRDKYSCVTHADLMSIGSRLQGWQEREGAAEHFSQFDIEADNLLESLLSKGIITANPSDGKPFTESECPGYERVLKNGGASVPAKHPFLYVIRFFWSCAKVDWHLRKKQLPCILARIEHRRLRAESSAATCNVNHDSTLIAAFQDLRPLYPRPYLCLFDSLALLEFLATYRLFPRVVFGVVADPFQAHCWLQDGNVVINDELEQVCKYKPILSI